jgi:hypothetical protein
MVPPEVPVDNSVNFDNIELAAQFHQLGLESSPERETNDGPPPKRRKVYKEDDLFDQTVNSLYSLLGAQKATDLDGLSQVAE